MTDLDQINVNTIRFLAVDAVERDTSGRSSARKTVNSGVNPATGLALLKEALDA